MRALMVSVALALAALPSLASADPASDLRTLISDYERFAREGDPIRAAQRGDAAAASRWADDTPGAVAQRRRALESFSARLAALAGAALPEPAALERDALGARVSDALDGLGFDEERMPFTSGEGFFINPDYAATLTVLSTIDAAESWLKRLEAVPLYCEQQTANMRRGIATRFTQPKLVVEAALRSVRAQAALPAADSPLLQPLRRLPATLPDAQRARLLARGEEIYRARVVPAWSTLGDFLERSYLPHARPELGARSLPDGARYYASLVRRHTTTDLTPEQVHDLGLREMARIRPLMDEAIRDAGYKGSFAQFLAMLRSEPRFFPRDADELMQITSEIANRANAQLPHFFGVLPRNPYAVVFMPSAMEGGSSGYWPGNPAQGVAGQVLLRRGSATKTSLYDLPAWVMHEGAPGHHIQVALAEEATTLPEYRRNDDLTAFVEGWALYAERLGEEMDIYRTPYERFGRLSNEMWRACRLVIDTGMHWMGWSREQAVACLRDNTALPAAAIDKEVDRYIGWPGQALAYKIGEIEMRDMRAEAERQLGARFDIRAFHDAVLGSGPLPLSVLHRHMTAWIATQLASDGHQIAH